MRGNLRITQPMESEVREVWASEWDQALASLARAAGDAGALHQARKSLKRLRALIRFSKQAWGRETRSIDRELGAIARGVSPYRDADVLDLRLAQLTRLSEARSEQADASWGRLLSGEKPALADREVAMQTAADALRKLGQRVAVIPMRPFNCEDGRMALQRSYRRTRRAGRDWQKRRDEERLHDWRKAVKGLMLHVVFTQTWGRAGWHTFRRELARMDQCLGDARDDFMLEQLLANCREESDTVAVMDDLRAKVRKRGRRNLRNARRLEARLFRAKSKAFPAVAMR